MVVLDVPRGLRVAQRGGGIPGGRLLTMVVGSPVDRGPGRSRHAGFCSAVRAILGEGSCRAQQPPFSLENTARRDGTASHFNEIRLSMTRAPCVPPE